MNELKSLIELFTKFTLKDIGIHLTNISNLYVKPLYTYRKIINYRNDSLNFFLLFISYYSIILFFLIDNTKLVLPITILELLTSTIPFLFLLPTFLLFKKIFKVRLKANRLFRLIFVIKLQYLLPLILLFLINNSLKIENIYVLIENFIILIFLALFLTFPFVLKVKLYQKIIWSVGNYFSILLYFIAIFFLSQFISENEKKTIGSKLEFPTPTHEYLSFLESYNFTDDYIQPNFYVAIINIEKNKIGLRNTQFSTINLVSILLEKSLEENNSILEYLKKLKVKKSNLKQIISSGYKEKEISLKTLDSVRYEFNKIYFEDKKTIDSLLKNTKFDSNRELFNLHKKRLNYYDSLYTNNKAIIKILSLKPTNIIKSDSSYLVLLYDLKKEKTIHYLDQKISNLNKKFEKREYYTHFLISIFLFPLEYLIEKFNLNI